jgi:hypothetical protein
MDKLLLTPTEAADALGIGRSKAGTGNGDAPGPRSDGSDDGRSA